MKKFLYGMIIQAFCTSFLDFAGLINLNYGQQLIAGCLFLIISFFVKDK